MRRGRRRYQPEKDGAETGLDRARSDVLGAAHLRFIRDIVRPEHARRAVGGIDGDDRHASTHGFVDDLAGAAAAVRGLAVPDRDEDVGLREHRQAGRFVRARQTILDRFIGLAGQRQNEASARQGRQSVEFAARSVVGECPEVDRRRAGQHDVERETRLERGPGGDAISALGERGHQREGRGGRSNDSPAPSLTAASVAIPVRKKRLSASSTAATSKTRPFASPWPATDGLRCRRCPVTPIVTASRGLGGCWVKAARLRRSQRAPFGRGFQSLSSVFSLDIAGV